MKIRLLVAAVLMAAAGCAPATISVGDLPAPARSTQAPAYDREAFGNGWADEDGDCQDTRQEILIRDLDPEVLDPEGCKVLSGTLADPYTGATIGFRRGQTTSDDVQIDHLVPLAYAWRAGAWQWTAEQREAFANDPAELVAVDGPTNNSKGSRGPSTWLPPDDAVHCTYAAGWRDVATSYGLVLDTADTARVEQLLSAC